MGGVKGKELQIGVRKPVAELGDHAPFVAVVQVLAAQKISTAGFSRPARCG